MKKTSMIAAALALLSTMPAFGQEVGVGTGDLLVRLRALGAIPSTSGHDSLLNGSIDAGNSWVPEIDAAYYFTDYLAVEAIAGTTRHDIKDKLSGGSELNLGHVWLLPPTVTAQLHPLGRSRFDPYLGAGVNYSIFYGASGAQNIGGAATRISYKNGFGYALQAGANYQVSGPWFFNVDVKKIYVSTSADVKLDGVYATHAHVAINPWLVGVGVGYRF